MIEILTENLVTVFHAMALLAISWLADCMLSTYRNVGILDQAWDKVRFFNSIKRLLVLVVGLTLIVVVVTDFPLFINETGIEIPSEYIEVFNIISILLAILMTAGKYAKGAIEAFFNILDYKKLVETAEKIAVESGDIELVEPQEVVYISTETEQTEQDEYVDDTYVSPGE